MTDGLPWCSVGKECTCQCRRLRFPPWVRKILRRKWQPTPVFLPGESHGQRSLVGYSTRGCKESDTTEHTRDYAGRSQHCSPCSDTVIPRCIQHLFRPETWAWEMCPLHWGLLRRNRNTFSMLLPSLIITSLPKRRCSVVCMLEWRRYGTEFKPVGKGDVTEVGNKPQLQGIKVQGQVTTE